MHYRPFVLGAAIVASFFAGTLVPTAHSQAPKTQFLIAEHMKAIPGEDYVKYEREWWQPIHKERVKQGKIKSWSLYGRRYPSGDALEDDFIVFTVVDKFENLNDFGYAEIFQKVFPGKSFSDMPGGARKLTRREIWQLVDEVK